MIIVKQKPSPHEVMIMFVALLAGLALLILRSRLGSTLSQELPTVITVILGVGLVVSSIITIIGMYQKSLIAPLIERAGLMCQAILLLTYSGFTADFTGIKGLITILFMGGIAIADIWRIIQLGVEVKSTENAIHQEGIVQAGGE